MTSLEWLPPSYDPADRPFPMLVCVCDSGLFRLVRILAPAPVSANVESPYHGICTLNNQEVNEATVGVTSSCILIRKGFRYRTTSLCLGLRNGTVCLIQINSESVTTGDVPSSDRDQSVSTATEVLSLNASSKGVVSGIASNVFFSSGLFATGGGDQVLNLWCMK